MDLIIAVEDPNARDVLPSWTGAGSRPCAPFGAYRANPYSV